MGQSIYPDTHRKSQIKTSILRQIKILKPKLLSCFAESVFVEPVFEHIWITEDIKAENSWSEAPILI